MVFVEESADQVASMYPSWLTVADDTQVGGWIRTAGQGLFVADPEPGDGHVIRGGVAA